MSYTAGRVSIHAFVTADRRKKSFIFRFLSPRLGLFETPLPKGAIGGAIQLRRQSGGNVAAGSQAERDVAGSVPRRSEVSVSGIDRPVGVRQRTGCRVSVAGE